MSLQIVATSRREHDIEDAFGQWAPKSSKIPMQQVEVDLDIRAYVRAKIHADPDLERWRERPEVQESIETELMKKADGM